MNACPHPEILLNHLALPPALADWGLPVQVGVWLVGILLVLAGVLIMPRILAFVLRAGPIRDSRLAQEIEKAFLESGLPPCRVAVWNTNGKFANAAVVGPVPGYQTLIVTDVMIEHFPTDQLIAIIRHEIGHIKGRHHLKRLGWAFLPLVALIIDYASQAGLYSCLANCRVPAAEYVILVGYVFYVQWLSSSLFRRMEFEADQFAILGKDGSASPDRSQSMRESLRRFAAIYPSQLTRTGGPHPSLFDRIIRLKDTCRDPQRDAPL